MNMNGGMMSFKHLFPKQGEEFTADVNLNIGESVNDNIITNNIYKVPGNTYLRQFKQQQIGKGENKTLFFSLIIQSLFQLTQKLK